MYKLKIENKAKKFLKTIPTREAAKILIVIEKLREDPRPRWVEVLKGTSGKYYRTSWGKYRIIYSIEDEILLVTVFEVDGRDDSYKKLHKRF